MDARILIGQAATDGRSPPRPPAARPPEGAFPHGHVARHPL